MKIDVLRFLAFPDVSEGTKYSRQNDARGEFKGDAGDIITPIDPESGYGQWKHIKNMQGWPWDLNLYDNHFVYDWVTEGKNGWSSDPNVGPKSYKKFIQNHTNPITGKFDDGLVMFPRYVDTARNNLITVIPKEQTSYVVFENCKQVGPAVSLGPVIMVLTGPYMINHGGDVGEQPTLIHQYYWINGNVPVLEENYYALDFGWIAWKFQRLNATTGFYEITNQTVQPLIFRVPEVKVVFPCF